jgi:small-conductance mechanosensitive channel
MDEILKKVYWGNTVLDYSLVLGGILLSWLVLRLIKSRVIGLLRRISHRSSNHFDDLMVKAIEKFIVPFAYLVINYIIITQLFLSTQIQRVLTVAIIFIATYYSVRIINFLICGGIQLYMERKKEPAERIKQLNGILLVIRAVVWIIGFITLIDLLGYNVTTIIAGLGVGGIAIALAAQNILGDLFSYLVIFFDKPFEIGDYIVVGEHSGTVEKIGIKTSHVRSLDGQQLVMPNAEMVKSIIQNYKRLMRRRMVFMIRVTYQTTADQLRKIPGMVRDIIDNYDPVTFDRAHFKAFSEYSIDFEIVYYIDSADFTVFMDTHQGISMDIFEKFRNEKIEFASPTVQTFIRNQNGKTEILPLKEEAIPQQKSQ